MHLSKIKQTDENKQFKSFHTESFGSLMWDTESAHAISSPTGACDYNEIIVKYWVFKYLNIQKWNYWFTSLPILIWSIKNFNRNEITYILYIL